VRRWILYVRVCSRIKPTEFESQTYESGGLRFDVSVRFSSIGCVKAGWLLKQKGRWSLTDEGRKAYDAFRDPEVFWRQVIKQYREWKASQPNAEPETADEPEEPTSATAASITFEQAEEQPWEEISPYLRGMNPYDFQDLVASLLRAMGYHVAWVSPPGKDGGLDIVALTDPLGTRPPRIKVQVKRQIHAVSVDGLRSFLALLGDDDVGLFVSTGGFTRDAADEARTQEKRKVVLVDLERLFDLWVEHYARLNDEARRRLPLKPIHFLAPEG
jgi:restriction system protein